MLHIFKLSFSEKEGVYQFLNAKFLFLFLTFFYLNISGLAIFLSKVITLIILTSVVWYLTYAYYMVYSDFKPVVPGLLVTRKAIIKRPWVVFLNKQ